MSAPLVLPLPEVAIPESHGQRWRIDASGPTGQACCAPLDAHIIVPLGANPIDANVRAHEQIHGRISRRKLSPKVDLQCQQACEDYRVHRWGKVRAGIEWGAGLIEAEKIPTLLAPYFPDVRGDGSPAPIDEDAGRRLRTLLTLARVSGAETGTLAVIDTAMARLTAEADQSTQNVVNEARTLSNKAIGYLESSRTVRRGRRTILAVDPQYVPDAKRALAVARWLERMLGDKQDAQEEPGPDGEEREQANGEKSGENKALKAQEKELGQDDAWRPWAPMEIITAPRPISALPVKRRAGWRVTDSGSRVRRPHRLVTDGRAFATKKRERGGTVLCDVSGSMRLTVGQLEELAEAAPAVKVAAYRHHQKGELHVLVAGKRRVATHDLPRQGSNFVDGPALRWVGKQKGPRVWVSDGFVTVPNGGTGAAQPYANILECRKLMRRYRIVRVPQPEHAIEYLKTGRVRQAWYEQEREKGIGAFRYRV